MRDLLTAIPVLARRILLETPGVRATVPMLRGVWGAALHDLDRKAYQQVFDPPGTFRAAGYVLRPAPPDPEFSPAVEFLLFGAAIEKDAVLLRAWDIASGLGLGPQRRRFHLRRVVGLGPDGRPEETPVVRTLDQAAWPLEGRAETSPCVLHFPAPLRLLRRGRLIESPGFGDVVVAACRRLSLLGPAALQPAWRARQAELLELSRGAPCGPWRGERVDLVRYSGRQKQEVTLRGVRGSLALPRGPGSLWPLLAAAQWSHIGKGAAMGLGQLVVRAP